MDRYFIFSQGGRYARKIPFILIRQRAVADVRRECRLADWQIRGAVLSEVFTKAGLGG